MDKIKEILERKRNGIDCSESESAEIKGFVKEQVIQVGTGEVQLIGEIQSLFPLEYGEALDEVGEV